MSSHSFSKNILLILFSTAAAGFLLTITARFGPGIAPDSLSYMSMAKHIAAGKGVCVYMSNYGGGSEPMASFSPLYPAALALFLFFGLPLPISVWILNGLLFGLNVTVSGYLILRITRNFPLALLTALAFFFDDIRGHAWILSEALLILMTNLSLLFIWKTLETHKRRDLVVAALAAAGASLAKYIGFVYTLSGALCLVLFLDLPFKKRLRETFWFFAIGAAPLALWLVRNYVSNPDKKRAPLLKLFGTLCSHDPTARPPLWPMIEKTLLMGRSFLSDLLVLPEKAAAALFLMILGICLIATIRLWKQKKPAQSLGISTAFSVISLYVIFHISATVLILYAIGYKFEIPDRYFVTSYGHLTFLILLFIGLAAAWSALFVVHKPSRVILLAAAMLVFLGWCSAWAGRTAEFARSALSVGADESYGLRREFAETLRWFPTGRSPEGRH